MKKFIFLLKANEKSRLMEKDVMAVGGLPSEVAAYQHGQDRSLVKESHLN